MQSRLRKRDTIDIDTLMCTICSTNNEVILIYSFRDFLLFNELKQLKQEIKQMTRPIMFPQRKIKVVALKILLWLRIQLSI